MNRNLVILLMISSVIMVSLISPMSLNGQYYTTSQLVTNSKIMTTDVCRIDSWYSNNVTRGDATCGAHEDFDLTFGILGGGPYDGIQAILQTKIQIFNPDSSKFGLSLATGYQYSLSSSTTEWVYLPITFNVGSAEMHINTGWASEYIDTDKVSGYVMGGRIDYPIGDRVMLFTETLYLTHGVQKTQVGGKFTIVKDIFSLNTHYSDYNGFGVGIFLAHKSSSF